MRQTFQATILKELFSSQESTTVIQFFFSVKQREESRGEALPSVNLCECMILWDGKKPGLGRGGIDARTVGGRRSLCLCPRTQSAGLSALARSSRGGTKEEEEG